jgi:L-fuculose-phosphate aldolase
MSTSREALTKELIAAAQEMSALDLVGGTSGNVSVRIPGEGRVLITPSSVPYASLTPADIVEIDFESEIYTEGRAASVEHVMHLEVFKQRADVGAVFHTHSIYASALAFLRIPLPALLEEMVVYVGGSVDVAEFAQTGTEELAENACKALGEKAAVLLGSHGVLCAGHNLAKGLHIAQVVERTARIYLTARTIGVPHELSEDLIETYGSIYEYTRSED